MAVVTTVDANQAVEQILGIITKKDNPHISLLEIKNTCECDMRYFWAYFDENSCGYMNDKDPYTLQPEPNELVEDGQTDIVGVEGNNRASGVIAFKVYTSTNEIVVAEIYFLNPHRHNNQVRVKLITYTNATHLDIPSLDEKKKRWDYFWDNTKGEKAEDSDSKGWLSISATMSTKPLNEYKVILFRNS